MKFSMNTLSAWKLTVGAFLLFANITVSLAKNVKENEKCDAESKTLYATDDKRTYLFCGLEGKFKKWKCAEKLVFSNSSQACVPSSNASVPTATAEEELLLKPFHQSVDVSGSYLNLLDLSLFLPKQTYCPSEQTPYLKPGAVTPQTCNLFVSMIFNPCPFPFKCEPAEFGSFDGYCCSSSVATDLSDENPSSNFISSTQNQNNPCPIGSSAYMELFTNKPVECFLTTSTFSSSYNGCPASYACYSKVPALVGGARKGVCCSVKLFDEILEGLLPAGLSSLMNLSFPLSTTAAASAFKASSTLTNQSSSTDFVHTSSPAQSKLINISLPTETVNNLMKTLSLEKDLCITGSPYYTTGMPLACNPSIPGNCPSGFSCQLHELSQVYYCCSGRILNSSNLQLTSRIGSYASAPSLCNGKVPYLRNGHSLLVCSPLEQGSCPLGYSCELFSTTGLHYCCQDMLDDVQPVTFHGRRGIPSSCPYGAEPLRIEQSLVDCASHKPCPPFYRCISNDNQNMCCPAFSPCPVGEPLPGILCSSGLPCQPGYHCVRNNQGSFCCPREEVVCTQPLSSGSACINSPSIRFYFEKTLASCRSFQFNGCGGNSNNFITQDHCEHLCVSAMCRHGFPLRTSAGVQSCSTNSGVSGCPQNYECESSAIGQPHLICCPKPAHICGQVLQTGASCFPNSTSSSTHFYFDARSLSCHAFPFGGCGGNENRFPSLDECNDICQAALCSVGSPALDFAGNLRRCTAEHNCPSGYNCQASSLTVESTTASYVCCPSAGLVCRQQVSSGSSCANSNAVPSTKWYFNVEQRRCQSFAFYGCQGNSNRFNSAQECQQFCQSQFGEDYCPNGETVLPEVNGCTLNVPNSCAQGFSCQLLRNTRKPVCCRSEPQRNGLEQVHATKAFRQCPQGSQPYFLPGSTSPRSCIPQQAFSCPSGYSCIAVFSTGMSLSLGICCRSRDNTQNTYHNARVLNTCPGNLKTINIFGNTPQSCLLNQPSSCPEGAYCLQGSTGRSICCQASAAIACPVGYTAFVDPSIRLFQVCMANVPASCPTGFLCTPTSVSGVTLCCQKSPAVSISVPPTPVPFSLIYPQQPPPTVYSCPDGSFPLLGSDGSSLDCAVSRLCPPNYSCSFVAFGKAVCCLLADVVTAKFEIEDAAVGRVNRFVSPTCPADLVPYTVVTTGQQYYCDDVDMCPGAFQCYRQPRASFGICCQTSETKVPQCPSGYFAHVDLGSTVPRECDPSKKNSCPLGYVCSQTDVSGKLLCCGLMSSVTCPAVHRPFIDQTTQNKLFCDPLSASCPEDYSCMTSSLFGRFLCCSTTNLSGKLCLSGATPYYYNGTTHPMGCSVGETLCPSGFSCQQSTTSGQYFCCPDKLSDSGGFSLATHGSKNPCSNGGTPWLAPTGRVQTCLLTSPQCSVGHLCVRSNHETATMICCSTEDATKSSVDKKLGPYCASGQKVLMTSSGSPLECIANVAHNCALGYFCTLNEFRQKYFCCSDSSSESSPLDTPSNFALSTSKVSCPAGTEPYLSHSKQQPLPCSISTPNSCPSGLDCTKTTSGGYYCCGSFELDDIDLGDVIGWDDDPEAANQTAVAPGKLEKRPSGKDCPDGFMYLMGECRKLMWPGQTGCLANEQCSFHFPNSTCFKNMCVCLSEQYLLGTICVKTCPDKYIAGAGRCHNRSRIKFNAWNVADLQQKTNGSLHAWCANSLIPEVQCIANNSYCARDTLTCECAFGYSEKNNDCK